MPVPAFLHNRLAVPVIGAPMFICSYPELVLAQCKAGILGTFPSLNARPIEELDRWLSMMTEELAAYRAANPDKKVAPFGVNLIIHKSNSRLVPDIEMVVKHKVPFIITSVGKPDKVCEAVHSYGGIVFHDVTNIKHAQKAIECGVDGLILVCAGAGGHAGTLSPFALLPEVRKFWDGPVALSGSITTGASIKAAQVLGADFAYIGTRFIASKEANAVQGYKDMIVASAADDIMYSDAFTGIKGNYLRPSVIAAGLDPDNIEGGKDQADLDLTNPERKPKKWKDIWGAGQGCGTIDDQPAIADIVARMKAEYDAAGVPAAA